jgi:heptosyltransferase-2
LISNAKNILIIRLSSLGDVLLTTPIVRSIKKVNPNCSIDFIVQNEFSDVYKFNPNINSLFKYDKKSRTLSDSKLCDFTKYDLVIDLQNNKRSKEIIKDYDGEIYRFKKSSFKKFLLVKAKINLMKDLPQIPVRYISEIENFSLDNEGLEIYGSDFKRITNKSEKSLIGLCPGSKHFTKMWPIDYYMKLADLLINKGYRVAVIGSAADKDKTELLLNNKSLSNYTTDIDLLATAERLAECSLVVCNDSGLMHLAGAVQTPLNAIFGSTVKEFGFTPYKSKNLVLENNSLTCRPCSHIGKSACPKKHFKCMREIKPEFVITKIDEMLND